MTTKVAISHFFLKGQQICNRAKATILFSSPKRYYQKAKFWLVNCAYLKIPFLLWLVNGEFWGGLYKGIDATAGGLVWVRRRNGSCSLPEGSVPTLRSGTPIKLLGKEDATLAIFMTDLI